MSGRQRLAAELRLALGIGLVGGLVLGGREALVTLTANAFVQPDQYLFAYLTVPVLLGMGLYTLLLVPSAIVLGTFARGPHLRAYAALLGFVGSLSIVAPQVVAIETRLREVGLVPDALATMLVAALALGIALVVAAVTSAAATAYAAGIDRWLGPATVGALLIAAVLSIPGLHFLRTDWKREGTAASVTRSPGPNVVLISIDTLRADHVGGDGRLAGLTPQLDRLAAGGVSFRQAITSAPWTLPAIASLLTARHPSHHGAGAITNRRDPLGRSALPPGSWTLATALRAQGYRTQAIVTNPYLALRYGLGDGFDGYENLTIESEIFLAGSATTAIRLLGWLWPDLVIGDRGETVSARTVRWLAQAGPDRFFLWLHYVDPHPPYSRAGVTRHKSFRGDSLFAIGGSDAEDFRLTSPDVSRLRSGEIRLDGDQKERVRELYRAEVASVDAAVGQVLEILDRPALRDRTLVVCVADHGEEFWEHGGVEHGHTVYEELVRVPLMMRWPGHLPEARRVDSVVRMIDVVPTVLDLLGLAPPPAADGSSALAAVRGEEAEPRVALIENLLFAEERTGIRTADRKYVRWETGKEEAYDLAADPRELRDLAGVETTLAPLRALHADLASNLARPTVAPTAPPTNAAGLRALGYVE
jgi:arylsulfatase A-like enzyme